MSKYSRDEDDWPSLVKIPADVDREDTVLGPLTARQALQLAVVAIVLWLGYRAFRHVLPPVFYLAGALPVATAATLAVLMRRDHLPLDRWLLAAWRHRRSPHLLAPHAAPEAASMPWQDLVLSEQAPARAAKLALPVAAVGENGVLDVSSAGRVALSRAGTVNFALRTGGEQQVLLSAFAHWLNALTGPAQILVRTQRLETGAAVAALERSAPELPHPLLELACLEHAAFLADLATEQELLSRQVLLAHRETGLDRAAALRSLRRAEETAGLLAAAEIPVRVLTGNEAFAQLAAAAAPDTPLHPNPALPDRPITYAEEGGAW
ncbi:PrgI family protein [Kitasatospora aureofaciens]|uniref:Uncharacterized protein n=1 Tax=Kitasatospora aureofaciens TaxID=1894 RepID=A0A1E7NAV4_KITAU|nr:PrgI family protein [Kitasatospora aureofaciens]ARF78081.1 PrgI family protein [Kitasatospora aureofaciens]OEV37784.1 hypothetical protein HS99_0024650 [Kitasatospora aureofaciens]GGV07689.1 hypothetical protein GCM10010502_73440 [Kitasatospora aureofaciens]